MMRLGLCFATLLAGLSAAPAFADTAKASCEIYPAGSDTLDRMVGCTFSQRQGYIDIRLEDGTEYNLEPVGDVPGNFRDQKGEAVYRQSGLGEMGQIFRFSDISIFLYWARGDQAEGEEQNATAPFSTDDYDATALLPCKTSGQSDFGTCPAGVARMEDQQASVTVQDPDGQQFTMNFMKDQATGQPYVNATSGEVEAQKDGDLWTVTIDGAQVYEVPEVLIVGD